MGRNKNNLHLITDSLHTVTKLLAQQEDIHRLYRDAKERLFERKQDALKTDIEKLKARIAELEKELEWWAKNDRGGGDGEQTA